MDLEMKNENGSKRLLKVKKKRNSLTKNKPAFPEQQIISLTSVGRKRTNPFACVSITAKKTEPPASSDKEFLNKLEGNPLRVEFSDAVTFSHLLESNGDDVQTLKTFSYEKEQFPLDWNLKHHVRFVSQKPFSDCLSRKPIDQYTGITSFIRNEKQRNLYSFMSCWIHPNIPGLPSYPIKRTVSGVENSGNSTTNFLQNNVPFQESTLKVWRESFQSLFNMLRTGFSPYFYMCAYQHTVLFQAAGICEKDVSAIITPTTKGFREMLKEEGIPFEFTVQQTANGESVTPTRVDPHELFDASFEEEEDSPNNAASNDNKEFLHSIGLTTDQHFPKLDEQQRIKTRTKFKLLDNRPESTIKVVGCNALFNFLLNANFLCSPSGRMAGIPPTLISPRPFEGASLSVCKASHGSLKRQNGKAFETLFHLDVNGLILPCQLHGLADYLTKKQEKLVVQMKSFPSLNALSMCQPNDGAKTDDVASKFGLPTESLDYLNQRTNVLPSICDVHFEDGLYKF